MVEPCSWDSEFFGFPVGRSNVADGKNVAYDAFLAEAEDAGVRLLYLFSEMPLKNFPVPPIDVKLIYSTAINPSDGALPVCEMLAQPEPKVYDLAYRSGRYSRFHTDPTIGEDKFREMYRIWVDNSFSGGMGDKVYVCRSGKDITGFVTLYLHDGYGSIGLIAVDENYARRGIGSALMNCCRRVSADNGLASLKVATQKANIEACAFYEKNGFVVECKTYIYHLWM